MSSSVVANLLANFPADCTEIPTPFEIPQVRVAVGAVHAVARWLQGQGFNLLSDVGGVDYADYPQRLEDERFEVVYHFVAVPDLQRLRVRVVLPDTGPEVASLADLYPSAHSAEREIWDQFGIKFKGHPGLTRILNPDDWEGHPLRKDYPLRGARDWRPQLDADSNRYFPIKVNEPETPGR